MHKAPISEAEVRLIRFLDVYRFNPNFDDVDQELHSLHQDVMAGYLHPKILRYLASQSHATIRSIYGWPDMKAISLLASWKDRRLLKAITAFACDPSLRRRNRGLKIAKMCHDHLMITTVEYARILRLLAGGCSIWD